jgi:UDP-3-O-[3-hydroxymyristoyl] glucosamine N-acyltransferase
MKLSEIAQRLECEVRGDGSVDIVGVAPIETAEPGTLTFVANPRYRSQLRTTRASAVLVSREEEDLSLPSLRCDDPYRTFADAIELFYQPPPLPEGVHSTAVIAASARIGARARIGPYAVIGENAVLGDDAYLDAHVVIYPEVVIGNHFLAHALVVVRERVRIGIGVILHSVSVICSDGFGYVLGADGRARKIVQAGGVEVGDDVEVGANTTVDRAAVGVTVIERGVKLDNLVMVAHGCHIGEGSAVAAQTGLSGSTRVGRFVRLGGQVGTAGHLSIGDGAQAAAQSGIPNDVAAGQTVAGTPAWKVEEGGSLAPCRCRPAAASRTAAPRAPPGKGRRKRRDKASRPRPVTLTIRHGLATKTR